MDPALLLSTFAAISLPDAIYVGVYTAMGLGPSLYSAMADQGYNMMGNFCVLLAVLWLAILFIIDCNRWRPLKQAPFAFILFFCFFAAATLRGVHYPWAGGIVCLIFSIASLGLIRVRQDPARLTKGGSKFYRHADISFFVCAIIILIAWVAWMAVSDRWWGDKTEVWLAAKNKDVYTYLGDGLDVTSFNYTMHCGKNKNVGSYAISLQAKITSKCKKANTVWFMQWSGPFAAAICNFACAFLCALFGRGAAEPQEEPQEEASLKTPNGGSKSGTDEPRISLRSLLQRCMLVLALTLACMYSSLYVSGATVNLGAALLSLGAVGTTLLMGWMYLEIDHDLLVEVATEAPFAQYVRGFAQSDWGRAFAVGSLHVFIPLMAILDMIRQKRRVAFDVAGADPNDKFTKKGRQIVDQLYAWNWCGIFQKVILLAELFVVLIVGSKFTFVFFSWLNETLAKESLKFGVVACLVFVIGVSMFMCPIVPGSAVYLFAGVVLGAQAQLPGAIGFWPGTFIACVVGSIAKLLACVGQYGLGYAAGKFVKVQQFVGVDKVPTRAMEQVLKEEGIKPGKICILVAGPDFPVSMTCGILKLKIPQMILGTTPVILVSIVPQTVVGALLTKSGADKGIWSMISTGVTGFAAVCQAGATLIYIYFIMKTVENDWETLAQYREEHKDVAALTQKEEKYVEAYKLVTAWKKLSSLQCALILSSVGCFLLASFTMASDFAVVEKYCFRSFAITDSIGAKIDAGGLDNNAWNLVMPVGWFALGLVVLGFALNFIFGKIAAGAARKKITEVRPGEIQACTARKRVEVGQAPPDGGKPGRPGKNPACAAQENMAEVGQAPKSPGSTESPDLCVPEVAKGKKEAPQDGGNHW